MPDLNKKEEIEDIFEEVDGETAKTPSSSIPESQPTAGPAVKEVIEKETPGGKSKLFMRIILIVAAFLLIAVVGYTIWQYFSEPATDDNTVVINTSNENVNEVVVNTNSQNINVSQPVINSSIVKTDSDRDGLLDEDEKELGTNPNTPDTDKDGLFDYEEVNVYHTDPTDPDTDKDGYKDGEEVSNGFNPNGTGKLYNLNQALQNINGQ